MMDRRKFFGGALAGIGGVCLPRQLEAKSVEPVLHGLTDLGMAQKIAEFPQGTDSVILPDHSLRFSIKEGCELRDNNDLGTCRSVWHVQGTVIYGTWLDEERFRRSRDESNKEWIKDFTMDVKELSFVRFRKWNPTSTLSKRGVHNMSAYRRLAVADGFGWFTLRSPHSVVAE